MVLQELQENIKWVQNVGEWGSEGVEDLSKWIVGPNTAET